MNEMFGDKRGIDHRAEMKKAIATAAIGAVVGYFVIQFVAKPLTKTLKKQ